MKKFLLKSLLTVGISQAVFGSKTKYRYAGATIAGISGILLALDNSEENLDLSGITNFEMIYFEFDEQNINYINGSIEKRKIKIHIEDLMFVFFDKKRITGKIKIEKGEQRYYVVGRNLENQLLTVIFAMRNGAVRPFNVWQTKGKLKSLYEKQFNTY